MSVPEQSTELLLQQSNNNQLQTVNNPIGSSGIAGGGEVAIFESGQRSLSVLKKEEGEEDIIKLIRGLVSDVFSFYGKECPEIAYKVIYDAIMTDYYFFKKADIELCFNRGMSSKYGKVDYFHAGVLTNWLNLYFEERTQSAEVYSDQKNRPFINQEWKGIMPGTSEMLLELAERIKPAAVKKFDSLKEYYAFICRLEEKSTDVNGWANDKLSYTIDRWKEDYDNPLFPHEAEQSFEDYVKSRTEEELLKINLNV